MVDRIHREIKYWCQIFLFPVYIITYLVPRSKKIWVFGSTFGRRFSDNPKYFYLYISQYYKRQTTAVWITKDKKIAYFLKRKHMQAYYLYSLKGIWYSLRAKVYFYDNYTKDICFTLSGGAVKINLWHGIPLKKIQSDNLFDKFRNPKGLKQRFYRIPRRMSDEKPTDYVLTTSEMLKPIFSSAFRTRNVLVGGYPRNEALITEHIETISTDAEQQFLDKLKSLAASTCTKIVMYMPTFRESETKFFNILSINDFSDFLKMENIIFCVKLHPKSKLQKQFGQVASKYIQLADSQADPYPLLKMADVLVTDYSSVYFDFLLTKKPIIFFPYDIMEYLTESRELYFNYQEYTPGVKVYTQKELEQALIHEEVDLSSAEVIKDRVFDNTVENASEILYHMVNRIIEN